MSIAKITKSKLKGSIKIPASKSFTHRALLCAALSKSKSVISNISLSDDTKITADCLDKLGCKILIEDDRAYINSTNLITANEEPITLDCKESSITLRLLIPVCAALGLKVKFIGEGTLIEKSLEPYKKLLPQHGVQISYSGKLPFEITGYDEEGPGTLKNGSFEIDSDVSSHFISGLLFAFPLIKGESKIILKDEPESKGYVDLTISVLQTYMIRVNQNVSNIYSVRGSQKYLSSHIHIVPDKTLYALYLCANKLGANINITNFKDEKLERKINDFSLDDNNHIDARYIPDLVPVFCILGALDKGLTRIENASRLKYKESNRLISCTEMINSLGGKASHTNDSIKIEGNGQLSGGDIDPHNDHRIVMASAIASICCKEKVIIHNYECVNKSYKDFFKDLASLGATIEFETEE